MLTVGTDSYISVADATAYLSGTLDADAWANADDIKREVALRTATRRIDMQRLIGIKSDQAQALQFPRCYPATGRGTPVTLVDPFDGRLSNATLGGYVCDASVPQAVLDATCEEALALLSQTAGAKATAQRVAAGVTSVSIGDASESYSEDIAREAARGGQRLLSPVARQLMAAYLARSVAII